MIKLIIYDLDGTLIDSATTVLSIINQMRANIDKAPIDKKTVIPWISLGGINLISNALELSPAGAEKGLIEFREKYLSYQTNESDLYPQVQKTLNYLADKGINLAICTNKPRILVNKIMDDLNLTGNFDYIVAGGDLTTQKPHPDNLLKCLQYFKYSANSVFFVGDSTVDQILAKACAVPFAFFRLGYDDGVDLTQTALILDSHADLLRLGNL